MIDHGSRGHLPSLLGGKKIFREPSHSMSCEEGSSPFPFKVLDRVLLGSVEKYWVVIASI